jgi:tetratricopeptide (TPR) repeat protein
MIVPVLLITLAQAAQPPSQQPPATPALQAFADANALYEKKENDKALEAYDKAISLDATNADFQIGRCRTLARLQRHEDAIAACSKALELRPNDPAAMLDRGHFYLNLHKPEQALADLAKASALNADAYGVAYHTALSYYVTGEYAKAADVYTQCVSNAKTVDNTVACTAWQYLALTRAGRKDDAAKVLERVTPDMQVKDSTSYLDRLLLFKGVKTEEQVAPTMDKDALTLPTVAYSIGVWHLLNGRSDRAREYFEKAMSPTAQKSAFGAVAADFELRRMKTTSP